MAEIRDCLHFHSLQLEIIAEKCCLRMRQLEQLASSFNIKNDGKQLKGRERDRERVDDKELGRKPQVQVEM